MSLLLLENKRWLRAKEPVRVDPRHVAACNGVHILEFSIGGVNYVLPLEKCACSPRNSAIYNGERYCEAEYCPEFLEKIINCDSIKVKGRVLGQALRVRGSIAEDATNPHALVSSESGERFVLKGYRLASRFNPEPAFLEYLSDTGIAPQLILSYFVGDQPLGVMTRYIEGGIDPGSVLYNSLISTLGGDCEIPADLLERVAATVSSFHNRMLECREEWCYPREAGPRDIEKWARRVNTYRQRLRELGWSNWLTGDFERLVEDGYRGMLGRKIIRTHGDLHFSQMLMQKDRFFLVDFEGEPGRPPEFQRDLEPAVRDIASMLRGVSYIAFFALSSSLRLDREETFNLIVRGSDPRVRLAREWSREVSERLVEAYRRSVDKRLLPGSSQTDIFRLVVPWFIERSLYEAYYEAMYRAENVKVALATLYNLIPPLIEQIR
ncbi:hypothetical protein [Infirmifilum sp. SLHALR2]|nr:MAG: hypothetical protein B7L53_02455 [Thermofilum sp. NZ13]